MLKFIDELLQDELGISIEECGGDEARFVYLDDGVFSGNQISRDLAGWVRSDACPDVARVDVVCLALHKGGEWNAIRDDGWIKQAEAATGKSISLEWWPETRLENRLRYVDASDVLVPTALPEDEGVRQYSVSLGAEPRLRVGDSVGGLRLFSSSAGRQLLEEEFLKAGVRIREMAPYLGEYQRPLGNTTFASLGFGTMVVTHRNCPNNAPLALWAGDPWYPLFRRRTN
jgi:hypothetical protein